MKKVPQRNPQQARSAKSTLRDSLLTPIFNKQMTIWPLETAQDSVGHVLLARATQSELIHRKATRRTPR
jgi:hypothetical protein